MNTVKLTKGKDMTISANGVALDFVTDFSAVQNTSFYEIVEFLSDEGYAVIPMKNTYTIELTALCDMNSAELYKNGFTISAAYGDVTHIYRHCTLKSVQRISKPTQNITEKYTICAKDMAILGGDGGD